MNAQQIVALSIFFSLIGLELFIGVKRQLQLYRTQDTFTNLTLGVLTSLVRISIKGLVLATFSFFHQYAFFDFSSYSIWAIVILLFLNDFIFYWYHRVSHESRIFWAFHVAHHSSQSFNFSTSIRGNFIHFLYRFIFWCPLALIGFDPVMILLMDQVGFFYQLFIHTKTIKKLPGFIEFLFNTPSHHRVHHGSNPLYLDKNYGAIFIIWDRIFGTFQAEKEAVIYGITKNIQKNTPIHVIFHELINIFKDINKPSKWSVKFKYIFGKPGWEADENEAAKKNKSAYKNTHFHYE